MQISAVQVPISKVQEGLRT